MCWAVSWSSQRHWHHCASQLLLELGILGAFLVGLGTQSFPSSLSLEGCIWKAGMPSQSRGGFSWNFRSVFSTWQCLLSSSLLGICQDVAMGIRTIMGKRKSCLIQQICPRCGFRTVWMTKSFYHGLFHWNTEVTTQATGVPSHSADTSQHFLVMVWNLMSQELDFLFSFALFKSLLFELYLLQHTGKLS